MIRRTILAMAFLLGLAATEALAHGDGPRLMGTVSQISADQITVEAEGRPAVAKITPETRFIRGEAVGKREDLKQGDRVVVHTRRKGDALEAIEVRYRAD